MGDIIRREVEVMKAISLIGNRNIITFYELITINECSIYVMEYGGESLESVMKKRYLINYNLTICYIKNLFYIRLDMRI